jgi:hypothetical protein
LSLDASDEPVRTALSSVAQAPLVGQALQNDDLLRRTSGLIDGLSRGLVLHKALPLPPPDGKFSVREEAGSTVMDPAGYRRFDPYARAIGELDSDLLAAGFHRFRPLLEQAYAEIGNPADELDNALIRALDRVIATPEIRAPISVKRKEALYLYADPALEGLAPLQKQLLRMGPDNVALVKAQARALRAALLGGETTD